jgi:hypothetical protein
MKRKPVNLKTKLAAALLHVRRYDTHQGEFLPVIRYEDSKKMTADEIIARFQFDHGIAHAQGGPDEPWNLTPLPIDEHRIKTATIDVPRIAKSKRIQIREAGIKKPRTITGWRKFNGEIVRAGRDR